MRPIVVKRFVILVYTAIVFLPTLLPTHVVADVSTEVHLALSSNIALSDPGPEELAAVFLGARRHWDDGTRVKIAILDTAGAQRKFLSAVAQRSPSQFWAHWRNIVFSGRGIMPKLFRSEEELITYLVNEKGAVGQIVDTDLASREGARVVTLNGVALP